MHFKHFNKDLSSMHVWRQTQTQSTINNFYEEDMNIFNPRKNDRADSDGIFRMEFPIMQWFVASLYKVFGNHLIITRLFMFFIGLLSVLGLYKLLNELFSNEILSVFGIWAFNFSPSFYYYTINPLPDNFALCCSIWGLAMFFYWFNKHRTVYLLISSALFSVGALSKLPFIIYFIVPFIYFIYLFWREGFTKDNLAKSFLSLSFVIFPLTWYLSVMPHWKGNMIVKGMLDNQESLSTLLDYFQHNLISTVPELLVGYGSLLFFIAGFFYLFKNKSYRNLKFYLLLSLSISALAYYFFEANAIAKIHDYYLFPFYPLLFVIVAYGAYNLFNSGLNINRILTYVSIVAIPVACYLRMQNRWNLDSPGFNKDLLLHKEALRNAVPKDALVVAGNDESHFIFFYYIDKKGWCFHDNNLTSAELKVMIDKGAKYLYTDSEQIINNVEIRNYLDNLILEKGSIKVFELIEAETR